MTVIETTATEATEQLAEALAPQPEVPVPAVVEHQAPAIVSETNALWQIAERVALTEMVPKALRGRPEAVFATVMYGRELGLGPMQSLQSIHFIEGKPSQSADLMRATVLRHGHTIDVREWTREKCVIYGKRKDDGTDLTVEYTADDAKEANLLGKDVWKKFRKDMLLARATTQLCRAKFSDCLSGVIYTPEELEDVGGGQQQGQARPPAEPGTMSEANQQAFIAKARERGLDDEAIRQVVLAASEGRTDRLDQLPATGTQVRALRAALEAWQPIEDAEVVGETPPAPDANPFETQGRQVKARKIADWLAANEVDDSDGSLTAATPEERRAIGESAGVANKAGTPPSDETWALVLDLVRYAGRPVPDGDAFEGVMP